MRKLAKNAKKNFIYFLSCISTFLFVPFAFPQVANAGATGNLTILPDWIKKIVDAFGDTSQSQEKYVNDRVKLALTILFIVVFIIAIAYSALAAIKFMSSQGDSGKLEESKSAVKAILMGFAAMLVAIMGIFLIVVIFGGTTEGLSDTIPLTPGT